MLTASWNRGSSSIKGGMVGCWPARPIPQSKTNMNEKEKETWRKYKICQNLQTKIKGTCCKFQQQEIQQTLATSQRLLWRNIAWHRGQGWRDNANAISAIKPFESWFIFIVYSFHSVSIPLRDLSKIGGNLVLFFDGLRLFTDPSVCFERRRTHSPM